MSRRLPPARSPRDASPTPERSARLALIDEGAERGSATLYAIEHGTPDALASEMGADLRMQYAILPGSVDFLGAHDYSRFTED